MRKVFFILSAVILLICFAQKATPQPSSSQAKPSQETAESETVQDVTKARIEVDETMFDFGFAPIGNAKLVHIFNVRNAGEDTLHITRVRSTCGCTAAPMKKKILAPGESSELKVIFRTRGYKRRTSKAVKIQSNDPTNSVVSVRFVANFDTTQWFDTSKGIRIKSDPPIINLGKAEKFQSEYEAKIENMSEEKIELKVVDFTEDVFEEVELDDNKIKGKKSTELEIKVDSNYDINQPVQASITIAAYDNSGSEVTRISIPVIGGGR